jgi:hypothetical protein
MKANTEEYYSLSDIIVNIKAFFHYLFRRWWVFVLAATTGIACGYFYYINQKPKYEAVSTFILEDKSSGGSSGLASLASQFGINVGGGSGENIFGGDNILNILKSKKIVKGVLLSNLDSTYLGNKTLADLYLEFTGLKKRWKQNPVLANFDYRNFNKRSIIQDSILSVIYEQVVSNNLLVERASKQGSIIKVQVTSSNAIFARLMTQRLVNEASKLYLNIRTGAMEANIIELENRSDSLLRLLNRKSFSAAANQPLDINPAVRTAAVPVEIANRDKTVLATLYAEVVKNLEASKLILSQQKPVIQTLDEPGLALENKSKGKLFVVTFAVFMAITFVVAVLLLAYILKTYQKVSQISPKKEQRLPLD